MERRELPRLCVNCCQTKMLALEGRLDVLLPKEKPERLAAEVQLLDLNERGCMVEGEFSEQEAQMLSRRTVCGFLHIHDCPQIPRSLFVKNVWVEPSTPGGGLAYRVGLYFEDCSARDRDRIGEYVNRLQKRMEPAEESVSTQARICQWLKAA